MSNTKWFPNFWQATGLLVCFMAVGLFVHFTWTAVRAYVSDYWRIPVSYALPFLLCLPLFFALYKRRNRQALGIRLVLPRWPLVITTLIIAFGVINTSNLLVHWLSHIDVLDSLNEPVAETFAKMYREHFSAFFITTVFLAPFFEELLFRGYFLESFLKNYKPWIAITSSAFLFGLLHANPAQFVTGFAVGLFLGYIYWRTDSLFMPILIHFFNNILAFIWLFCEARRLGLEKAMKSPSISGTQCLGFAVSGVVASFLWYRVDRMYKKKPTKRGFATSD